MNMNAALPDQKSALEQSKFNSFYVMHSRIFRRRPSVVRSPTLAEGLTNASIDTRYTSQAIHLQTNTLTQRTWQICYGYGDGAHRPPEKKIRYGSVDLFCRWTN